MKTLNIYFAGPLFSLAERMFNTKLAQELTYLRPDLHCVLPQTRAEAFLPNLQAVVQDCWEQVAQADALVVCLEGSDADSGTCAELGYARALGKPIVGYRTDFRGNEIDGVNAMLRYGCNHYIQVSSTELERAAQPVHVLARRIEACLPRPC